MKQPREWYLEKVSGRYFWLGMGIFLAVFVIDEADTYDNTIKKLGLFGLGMFVIAIVTALLARRNKKPAE